MPVRSVNLMDYRVLAEQIATGALYNHSSLMKAIGFQAFQRIGAMRRISG